MTMDEMLAKLDMHGVLMLQGMLVNRGLQLLQEPKEEPKKADILVPDRSLAVADTKLIL